MCGIAGLVTSTPSSDEPVRRMVDAMRHRGPDDAGVETPVAGVVLGSARLSIIDLSPAGHQPMPSEDGRVWVAFNGEVYNFRHLRTDLEKRGHRFHSRTDTEVILHAYEEWGPDCVLHLRGMFAVAVVDARQAGPDGCGTQLLLLRDHLGIKPLYFTVASGALAFASEVRALLASGLVPTRLSTEGLAAYLLWGSVAEPLTLVDGIRSLPPGYRLTAKVESGALKITSEPYWHLPVHPVRALNGSRAKAVFELRSLLHESVAVHLVADVPVGVFLSGGVDSTCVAGLAARAHSEITTVTVTLPEDVARDEAVLARETARHLGVRHHAVVLTGPEILHHLDEAVAGLDQPSMDGINTYFVSWGAHQAGLKVALSGLGGDELFGGYSTFRVVPRLEMLVGMVRRSPLLGRLAAGLLGASLLGHDARQKLADAFSRSDVLSHPYAISRALFSVGRLSRLLNGSAGVALRGSWADRLVDLSTSARGLGAFSGVSALELGTYLVNTLLRDTDGMSMAHSLEVRVPFVDHRLVEFVGALPEIYRSGRGASGRPKALLLEAVGDIIPIDVARARKRTFTLPWEQWLRGPLREKLQDGIAEIPDPLRLILNPQEVQAVWNDFLCGRTGWARPWALYVLNDWVRRRLTALAPLGCSPSVTS